MVAGAVRSDHANTSTTPSRPARAFVHDPGVGHPDDVSPGGGQGGLRHAPGKPADSEGDGGSGGPFDEEHADKRAAATMATTAAAFTDRGIHTSSTRSRHRARVSMRHIPVARRMPDTARRCSTDPRSRRTAGAELQPPRLKVCSFQTSTPAPEQSAERVDPTEQFIVGYVVDRRRVARSMPFVLSTSPSPTRSTSGLLRRATMAGHAWVVIRSSAEENDGQHDHPDQEDADVDALPETGPWRRQVFLDPRAGSLIPPCTIPNCPGGQPRSPTRHGWRTRKRRGPAPGVAR